VPAPAEAAAEIAHGVPTCGGDLIPGREEMPGRPARAPRPGEASGTEGERRGRAGVASAGVRPGAGVRPVPWLGAAGVAFAGVRFARGLKGEDMVDGETNRVRVRVEASWWRLVRGHVTQELELPNKSI
jgi:hypothetical protein